MTITFNYDMVAFIPMVGLGNDTEELIRLAKTMLRLAAIYPLADITNLVFAGALRGAGDTGRS